MSSLSMQKSLRTCKVDTSWADKMKSERVLTTCELSCPMWNGLDQYGRSVCQDTCRLETAGCTTASDRINIENYHRPAYFTYVNLDGFGIQGRMYENSQAQAKEERDHVVSVNARTGTDYLSTIRPTDRHR